MSDIIEAISSALRHGTKDDLREALRDARSHLRELQVGRIEFQSHDETQKNAERCVWRRVSKDQDLYDTSCLHRRKDEGMGDKYCPCCGKQIEFKRG